MPPKKVDPEQLKRDFEAWKEGDEYKKMEEVVCIYLFSINNLSLSLLSVRHQWTQIFLENTKFFGINSIKCLQC